jgi:hypothetical protein
MQTNVHYFVRFVVLIAVTVNRLLAIFGDVLLCILVSVTGNSGKMLHPSSGYICSPIKQEICAVSGQEKIIWA